MEQIYSYTRDLLVRNGKVKKDKEEELRINDRKIKMIEKEKGKKTKEVKISKKEFQNYLEKQNGRYHVDTNMFKEAVEKINSLLPDVLFRIVPSYPEELPVERADNGTRPRLKNQLAIEVPRRRNPKPVCYDGLRYFGVGSGEEDKRNRIRYVYEKRMDEIGPNKCNTSECISKRKEVNRKYWEYMEETNDCE
jgi:hypothetical protein